MVVNDYVIFRNNQCSLQETSKDTSTNQLQFMTSCRKKVVNFDRVKTQYCNDRGMSEEKASSVDAFIMEELNYLIEFKNGDVREEKNKVLNKAKDSILILNSILNRQIEDSRKKDVFILVYNENKIEYTDKERRARMLAKKGRQEFVLFGFDKMKEFCFQDVMTLNQEEFEEQIVKKLGW